MEIIALVTGHHRIYSFRFIIRLFLLAPAPEPLPRPKLSLTAGRACCHDVITRVYSCKIAHNLIFLVPIRRYLSSDLVWMK